MPSNDTRIAELEATVAELRDQVAALIGEPTDGRSGGAAPPRRVAKPASALSRRGMLAATGAAAGLLVTGRAQPAAAANGDNVVLGTLANSATATTGVSTTAGNAVQGSTSAASASGVRGVASNASGTGVRGDATATSGSPHGMIGTSAGFDGVGVKGETTSTNALGNPRGVHGRAAVGIGVFGHATALTGTTRGVAGQTDSTEGTAVGGFATATTGTTAGVRGTVMSAAGKGVYGNALATSGLCYGVFGQVASPAGYALFGQGRMKVTGRSYLATPNSAPADVDLTNGSVSMYLNEAGNQLKVRVKYSSGAVKTGTVNLS
jgi:hypothetical protein